MRSVVTLALALGGLPAALAAQPNGAQVPPGARVRVSAPSRAVRVAVGTLVDAGPDTIAITATQAGGGRIALPRSAITRFEVSRDRQSRVLAGAIWGAIGAPAGALAGAASGVVYGAHLGDGCDRGGTEQECRRDSDRTVRRAVSAGAILGLIAGGVGGAIYGVKHRRERWQLVDMPVRVAVVVPGGLGLSFAFGRP